MKRKGLRFAALLKRIVTEHRISAVLSVLVMLICYRVSVTKSFLKFGRLANQPNFRLDVMLSARKWLEVFTASHSFHAQIRFLPSGKLSITQVEKYPYPADRKSVV